MEVKDRLILFLEHLKIGQKKFEENVGLSNGFVNNIGVSITSKSINKISSKYPQLNTDWLLTGQGEMLQSNWKDSHVSRTFMFSIATGLRWGDVKSASLKWAHIRGNRLVKSVEKSERMTYKRMNQMAVDMLPERGQPEQAVFEIPKTNNGSNKALKKWLKQVGINKHITWHCARHTFGSIVVEVTDLRTSSGALDHSDGSAFKYVMRYSRLKDKNLDKAVDDVGFRLRSV